MKEDCVQERRRFTLGNAPPLPRTPLRSLLTVIGIFSTPSSLIPGSQRTRIMKMTMTGSTCALIDETQAAAFVNQLCWPTFMYISLRKSSSFPLKTLLSGPVYSQYDRLYLKEQRLIGNAVQPHCDPHDSPMTPMTLPCHYSGILLSPGASSTLNSIIPASWSSVTLPLTTFDIFKSIIRHGITGTWHGFER